MGVSVVVDTPIPKAFNPNMKIWYKNNLNLYNLDFYKLNLNQALYMGILKVFIWGWEDRQSIKSHLIIFNGINFGNLWNNWNNFKKIKIIVF